MAARFSASASLRSNGSWSDRVSARQRQRPFDPLDAHQRCCGRCPAARRSRAVPSWRAGAAHRTLPRARSYWPRVGVCLRAGVATHMAGPQRRIVMTTNEGSAPGAGHRCSDGMRPTRKKACFCSQHTVFHLTPEVIGRSRSASGSSRLVLSTLEHRAQQTQRTESVVCVCVCVHSLQPLLSRLSRLSAARKVLTSGGAA